MIMHKIIKKKSSSISRFLRKFSRKKKIIKNYYNTCYKKNALISYIDHPFRNKGMIRHSNEIEIFTLAEILKRLKFNIDVVSFNSENIKFDKHYDLAIGFGVPLTEILKKNNRGIVIYYSTGSSAVWQNPASMNRIDDLYRRKGIMLLGSGRFNLKYSWAYESFLSDAIITFGNKFVQETYRKFFSRKIYPIPVTFIDREEIDISAKDFSKAKSHFLWFGGAGLVHKGLDLLLDYFDKNDDIDLHICGKIASEPDFENCFKDLLYHRKNIHVYGFIDVKSGQFEDLIKKCAFVILPSCSEGEASSVITCMVHGLIPITTESTGISTSLGTIPIKELTQTGIDDAVKQAQIKSESDLKTLSNKYREKTREEHSLERYKTCLTLALKDIIK